MQPSKKEIAAWIAKTVNFQAPPPDPVKSFVAIVRPKVGQKFSAFSLADQIHECQTHYIQDATLPCFRPKAFCQFCEDGSQQRWYGYLPCQFTGNGRLCILSITPGLARTCPALKAKGGLRHKRIIVERVKAGTRGVLVGRVEEHEIKGVVYQPEPNVPEILANIWAPKLLELGVLPPVQAACYDPQFYGDLQAADESRDNPFINNK